MHFNQSSTRRTAYAWFVRASYLTRVSVWELRVKYLYCTQRSFWMAELSVRGWSLHLFHILRLYLKKSSKSVRISAFLKNFYQPACFKKKKKNVQKINNVTFVQISCEITFTTAHHHPSVTIPSFPHRTEANQDAPSAAIRGMRCTLWQFEHLRALRALWGKPVMAVPSRAVTLKSTARGKKIQ